MAVTDDRFIREATQCLYSSLDIESALHTAYRYFAQYFPLDLAHMFIYDTSREVFRYLALATEKRGILIDERIQLSSRAKKEIRGHAPGEVRVYTKSRSEVLREVFTHFRMNTRNPLIREQEEFSALCIVLDIGMPLTGGFSMVSRGGDCYTADHIHKLKRLESALTGAVLNLLHHRKIVLQNEQLTREKDELQKRLGHGITHPLIGAETGLAEVMELVRYVGPTGSPVLITGETGAGKELIAHAVHRESICANGPFVCINCGAIPESLMDSELFGHEKGAFTGALGLKRGYFEQADGGTIFLDEVGELPMASQVKFLRVLQAMEFRRVGGNRSISVNVRIIAATNRNLLSMVQKGQFREDLWFRLNVFPIVIPPLRERKEDIPAMAEYFLERKAREMSLARVPVLDDSARAELTAYHWPGNIRELQNVIERALIVNKDRPLSFPDLTSPKFGSPVSPVPKSHPSFRSMDTVVMDHIKEALTRCQGRIDGPNGAARLLSMNPSTLRGRMRKYGIATQRGIKVEEKG